MNRIHTYFLNTSTSAINQLFVISGGFLIPRIILFYMGSEANGLISSINNYIYYLYLFEGGLSGVVAYALYKPIADNNNNEINAVVSASKHLYNKAGYIFIFFLLLLSFVNLYFIDLTTISNIEAFILFLILGIKGISDFFVRFKYDNFLVAAQKTYIISISEIFYNIIYILLIVVLSALRLNIIFIFLSSFTSLIIRNLILIIYVRKKYTYINYKVKPDIKALSKRKDAFYIKIYETIYNCSPIVIITIISHNLFIVSIYSIYHMILSAINSLLSIFVNGLTASFGDILIREENYKIKKLYNQFELCYYCLLTVIYTITFIMIIPFIKLYTSGISDINYEYPLYGFLFVLNGFLYNLKTPQNTLIISAGRYKEARFQTTVQGIIMICLGSILGYYYNITGILIASIISNIFSNIYLLLNLPFLDDFYKTTGKRLIWVSCIIFIITISIDQFRIQISNYLNWFFISLLLFVFSLLIVILICILFEKQNLFEIKYRIFLLIKEKLNKESV